MYQRHIKPTEGGPLTIETSDDNGHPTTTVYASALTPFRAKILDRVSISTLAAATGWTLFGVIQLVEPSATMLAAHAAFPGVAFFAARKFLGKALQRKVCCKLSDSSFTHTSIFGTRAFDRSVPHRFALFTHDKAHREHDELELVKKQRAGKWWAWTPKRYYGQSFHLVFEYMGQRNDIMTIFGRKQATQILDRLQACELLVLGNERHGAGIALKADEDWSRQPGELPPLLNQSTKLSGDL